MKRVALFFSFFFVVFFVLGFIDGRGRALDPEEIKLLVASKSTLIFQGEKAYLQIALDPNETTWVFDVDSNEIKELDPALIIQFRSHKKFPVDDTMLKGFIGGTTAWKLQDVVKAVSGSGKNPADRWAIVMGLVGGVSGYIAGHYTGNFLTKKTIREQLVPVLQDAGACKDVKRLVLLLLYKQHHDEILRLTTIAIKQIGDRNAPNIDALIRVLVDIKKPDLDITSQHFAAFKQIEQFSG